MVLATNAGRPSRCSHAPLRGERCWRGLRRLGWGLGLALLTAAGPARATPAFDDPAPSSSADGSLQLSWGEQLGDFEVRLSHDEDERIVYSGRFPSAHVSGLPNGRFELQVRAREGDNWSAWSEPKVLEVEHHPMALVWTLMALGALVFAGTAAVVLRSDRRAS